MFRVKLRSTNNWESFDPNTFHPVYSILLENQKQGDFPCAGTFEGTLPGVRLVLGAWIPNKAREMAYCTGA